MLGKGLESLIPQKGNQGAPKDDHMPASPAQQSPQQFAQPQHQAVPTHGDHNPPAFTPRNDSFPPRDINNFPMQQQSRPVEKPSAQRQPIVERPFVAERLIAVERAATQPVKKDELAQESIFHIEIEKITGNPDQPRRHFDQAALHELANSIREFGFLQPIVVSKVEKESPNGIAVEYQIIAGERRFMAAKLLGLPRVPAIVRNVNLEREKLELGVIENIQRENLNPIETARAFQRLQEEFRMTQREIAAKLGKSREVVANSVRLLDLPEYIQLALQSGEVSESHARLLLGVDDPAVQKQLLEDIKQNKLTTRDVKERVQQVVAGGGTATGGARRGRPPLEEVHLTPEVRTMREELSQTLGAPVEISKNANNGKISITFFSEEELENILRRLRNE